MTDELKVYPVMLHESTWTKLQKKATDDNKKVEDIMESLVEKSATIESLAATNNLVMTNIYHNIERPLSQALQPETNLPTIHRLVTGAREHLHKFMRDNGFKGQF